MSKEPKPQLGWRGNVIQIAVASAIVLWASAREWANIRIDDKGLPSINVHLTGAQIQPLFIALSLVIIAAALSLLTIRGSFVKVIVAFMLALGVFLEWQSLSVHSDLGRSSAVRSLVIDRIGHTEVTYGAVTGSYAYLLATLGSAMIILSAFRMLKQQPPLRVSASHPSDKPAFDVKLGSAWKQLDRGDDPTDWSDSE